MKTKLMLAKYSGGQSLRKQFVLLKGVAYIINISLKVFYTKLNLRVLFFMKPNTQEVIILSKMCFLTFDEPKLMRELPHFTSNVE